MFSVKADGGISSLIGGVMLGDVDDECEEVGVWGMGVRGAVIW